MTALRLLLALAPMAARACFAPWAPVLLGNGSQVPIAAVRPGDLLASWDEALDSAAEAPVLIVESCPARELLEAAGVAGAGGLVFSPEQVVYSASQRRAMAARQLDQHDLLQRQNGSTVAASMAPYSEAAPPRLVALRLAGPHWFYAAGVRVHNEGEGEMTFKAPGIVIRGHGSGGMFALFASILCCANGAFTKYRRTAFAPRMEEMRQQREAMPRSSAGLPAGLAASRWTGKEEHMQSSTHVHYELTADAAGNLTGSKKPGCTTQRISGALDWPAGAERGQVRWAEEMKELCRESWAVVAEAHGSISRDGASRLRISATLIEPMGLFEKGLRLKEAAAAGQDRAPLLRA